MGYVEDAYEARTPLVDFSSILQKTLANCALAPNHTSFGGASNPSL